MDEGRERGFRLQFLVKVGIVLAVLLAGATALLIYTGVREQRYASAIEMANQYYNAGNYSEAIPRYEEAIRINDKKESAYLNLISAYMMLGDYDSAMDTVEQALLKLDSVKLRERKGELETLIGTVGKDYGTELLSEEEIRALSQEAALENTMFDMAASYTYTEYFRDFGSPDSAESSGNRLDFYYSSVGFHAFYYDLEKEKVLDAGGNRPVATAKPVYLEFENLRSLFSESGEAFAVSRGKLEEFFGDDITFFDGEAEKGAYLVAEYKGCRLTVYTDAQGNIVSETAQNSLEPLNRSRFEEDEEAEGEVSGYVQDAVTGSGMKATLKIRERGRRAGQVIRELTSGTDGSYTYGGDQGIYTAEVSAAGYITEYMDLEIVRGQVKTGKNVVLSPEVAEGELRIVLTWGSSPADLDAYAIGTSSDNRRFNIHFTNKRYSGIGELDVDDTSGFGPETITITDTGASFTYSVMDYRLTGLLPTSGAKVKVYLPGNAAAQEFSVPSGEGVLWEVFRYENGEIIPVERLLRRDEFSANSTMKSGG